jgi:hypothetical protein
MDCQGPIGPWTQAGIDRSQHTMTTDFPSRNNEPDTHDQAIEGLTEQPTHIQEERDDRPIDRPLRIPEDMGD